MNPRIVSIEIAPPYPWRMLRREEYSPVVDGETITIRQMPRLDPYRGAPELISTVRQPHPELVAVDIVVRAGEGRHAIYATQHFVWDGSTWIRRRIDHRDVRMRLHRGGTNAN